jgi:glyoxylase-like metal-dependent hydrolase (beta-lactamase superfamily II)
MKAAVIDPGGEVPRLLRLLRDQGLTLEKIWVTHGHLDHAGGAAELKEATGAPIEGPHPDDQDLNNSITGKLWPQGDDVTFVPGHKGISTFGAERKTKLWVSDTAGVS